MSLVMIAGMGGQLGYELTLTKPEDIQLIAPTETELDITAENSVFYYVKTHSPNIIINCAAYNNVDKAEQNAKNAFAVNKTGVENLALASKKQDSFLIHISTDFVFDGAKSSPYQTTDSPNPISTYGSSKLAGENATARLLENYAIIRAAWLYSSHGNNFVKTMIRLMQERSELNVVCDQIGTPTWANSLANVIWQLINKGTTGLFHWTDAGVASWYDFAVAIYEESSYLGLLNKNVKINPIPTTAYPTPAKRPLFSVLDKTKALETFATGQTHWRSNLRKMLIELKKLKVEL
jgi:dTDP-4-dehydrorhamnose reductase